MSRFDTALQYVLVNEGPYSNDPRDPGGATKFGIILTEYQDYLGRDLTPEEVENMDLATAQAIYIKKFWNPIQGDAYASDAVATAIFDTAVNKGLGGCKLIIANALHHQAFQGQPWEYGPDLLLAVAGCATSQFLPLFEGAVEAYIAARIARFPNMEWARAGWTNRAKRLLTLQ